MTIPGYILSIPVCEAEDLILYQATRVPDGVPVLLKVPAGTRSSPLLLNRLQREYELARDLDSELIARPLALERNGGDLALVLEQGPERSLAAQLGAPMDVGSFLRIAIAINASLAEVHRHELVHKDVKPENVLLDAAGHVWLTGLGIASRLPRERQAPEPPEVIAGTLAYMAPEQTGRMNRSIDSRSDLYALGVTFYQMLTGVLPFTASDAMEWVHCHIARQPIAPSQRVPDLPEPLSAIVMKLLAKMAEERYQSTLGLDADLRRCLTQWESQGRIEPFPLGERDVPDRLLIPERLYGRQAEINALLAAFNRIAASGTVELVLVSGYSGIGKTSVVHELHKALVPFHGLFAAGKFDQYKRNVPYATLVQALQTLIRHILCKGQTEMAVWCDKIETAVAPNGQLIVNLIPEVEMIIGKQPPLPELPPQEAQNRFQRVLWRFLGVFTAPEHPLVLFLDDLQWLDTATLDLIEQLVTGQEMHHLLLIGAYRDNEVGPTHPLTRIIEAIRETGAGLREIVLTPLAVDHACSLVADALHCERERALALAQLVHEKTGGNPFFAIQFLTELADEALLAFGADTGSWSWNLAGIHAKGYTDNVVDLMIGKLNRLPAATLSVLEQFSCLGNVAEVSLLKMVCGQSEESLQALLWDAVRSGMLLVQEKSYAFVHDRVREAAYSLISAAERKAMHWKIGRLLLNETPSQARDEGLFDVVNHLNLGRPLQMTQKEVSELVELNRQAGRKAMASAAFATAMQYFDTGLKLLENGGWQDRYSLALALHQEAAEAACLCGYYDRLKTLAQAVHLHAASLLDEIPTYETEIRALTAQGRLRPSIQHGLSVLERLGMRLSEEPAAAEVEEHLERTLLLLNQTGIEALANLPIMSAPEQLACIRILSALGEPAYAGSPQFFLVWASEMAELSLRYGNSTLSPFAYSAYALALCASGRDIEMGSRLAKAALALIEALNARSLRCRLLNIYGCTIQPWTEHLRDTLATLQEAVDAGAESGDFTSGSYAAFNSCTAALFMGEPLDKLSLRLPVNMAVIAGMKQTYIWNWVAFHLLAIQKLRGATGHLDELGPFDEARWLAAARDANDQCGLAYYFLGKLTTSYLLGEAYSGEALDLLNEVKANQAGFQGAFAVPVFYFYAALALLKQGLNLSSEELDNVRDYRNRLEDLARLAPMNFQHKSDLLAAELARISGEDWQAARLYEQAFIGAGRSGFLQEEAIAHELAAGFYLEHGMEETAQYHIRSAHKHYTEWQSWAKVRALEADYPRCLAPETRQHPGAEAGNLDISSVMKAAYTIASEIEMKKLLAGMMRIVIENAGAQEGFLILDRDGVWEIEAMGEIDPTEVKAALPVSLEDCELVSSGVVHYVVRSKQIVVLDDATNQGEFINDPHIRRERTKSLLCAPLLSRGRLIGVLYLKNNLTTHAFTAQRVQLLEMLLSQAATSLENALVYEALQESESKYRRIVDTANEGIWVLGPDALTTSVNARMAEMLGVKAEDMIGRPLTDFMFEEDVPHHLMHMEKRRQGESEGYERRFRRSTGEALWIFASATPIFDDEHRFQGAFAMHTDITERKQAEEELRRLTLFQQTILNSAAYGIISTTPDGIVTGLNPAAERLLGYTADEVIGKQTPLLWHDPQEIEQHARRLSQELGEQVQPGFDVFTSHPKRNLAEENEWTFICKDGTRIPVNLSVTALSNEEDRLIGFVGLIYDLSERKRAEDERRRYRDQLEKTVMHRTEELLLARNAAEAANKAKSQFLANMSHELRTPMNAILGFSNMMRRDPHLTENQKENLAIINRSGEQLLNLINDVLEVSKIEAGHLQLDIAPFDLDGTVRDVTEMMQIRAQEKGLRLLFVQSSKFPRYIKGDEARIRQIIINLIGNAVKFTQQGSVTLRLGVKKNDRQHLLIEVEDTGPGIAPENQQRLFEPFVQLTEGDARYGTGLGLTITRQFVQKMGGSITVESALGKGALFRVDLPVELVSTANIPAAQIRKPSEVVGLATGQPRYRIMIVEDQPENQLLLSRLMTDLGLEVKVVANGQQCLELFADWHPDLIWMDRRMPVMDGIETTKRLRQLPQGSNVKIVAVTASALKEQQQEIVDAGMDDLIRKPYRFEEIYDCLARQLGVEYIYQAGEEEISAKSVVLTPVMLSALPSRFRRQLKEALESLDSERTMQIIRQIGEIDAVLGHTLFNLAEEFDYPSILTALGSKNEGAAD